MAIDAIIRRAVASDLDSLMLEIDGLRKELMAVREAAGVPIEPPQVERRERVAAMRRSGMSTRAIALAIGVNRATVAADLRVAGVPAPQPILGLDGRLTRGPRPSPAGQSGGLAAG